MVDLTKLSARAAVALLKQGEVSPLELIDAAMARIEAVEPAVNALPTLCPERARERAKRIMDGGAPADAGPGWLAGLPIAVKDLNDVAGVRTTYGSPVFADHVPERSDIMVDTLERAGAVVLAKSNTPEFGAGGNTFNEVFGKTRNPWNTAYTCGGSSGGSATALATGEIWLATGSDLGGSLRMPASFCSVIGLRPSPGRVAHGPKPRAFDTLSVEGPMARDVPDTALFLDAMVGADPGDPISLAAPALSFQDALARGPAPRRVAFSPDLGITPVAAEVKEICAAAAARFAEMGARVEEACPDFSDAPEIFHVERAAKMAAEKYDTYTHHRALLKPEIIWNVEKGLALTPVDIGRAERARSALYHRVLDFLGTYDLLVCPATIVAPFDVDQRYVTEVEGHHFDNYVDWFMITAVITLTSLPAISVPCGFTADGRPVGLQMVAGPRGEGALLAAAARFEEITGLAAQVPLDPRGP